MPSTPLEAGADIDRIDGRRRTPLGGAIFRCAPESSPHLSASIFVESTATKAATEEMHSNLPYRRGYTLVIGRVSGCEDEVLTNGALCEARFFLSHTKVIFARKPRPSPRTKRRSPSSVLAPSSLLLVREVESSNTGQLETYTLAQSTIKFQRTPEEVAKKVVLHPRDPLLSEERMMPLPRR
ncbi:hypothetical protein F4776DRAFT_669301 [Hypoxylon sp. NC0597]|nr:hypothetical protein F4776DRAFT_669301 [Hypoxylon sp. NC0597]